VEDEASRKILQVLTSIDGKLDKLDDLLNVMKMGQKASIEQTKADMLGKSKLRRDVYKLCDGRHSVSEVAEALNKSISLVSQSLAALQEAGLIAEERRGKTRYYDKVV
jgi:DNA-binding transcriptional ArsR family regulator